MGLERDDSVALLEGEICHMSYVQWWLGVFSLSSDLFWEWGPDPYPWPLDSLSLLFLLSERREGEREGERERERERGRERSSVLWDNLNFSPFQRERGNRASFVHLHAAELWYRLSEICCDLFNSFPPLILIKFLSCLQAWGAGTKHETLRAKCFSFAIEFFRVLKVLHGRDGDRHPEAEAFPVLHQSLNNKHKN